MVRHSETEKCRAVITHKIEGIRGKSCYWNPARDVAVQEGLPVSNCGFRIILSLPKFNTNGRETVA